MYVSTEIAPQQNTFYLPGPTGMLGDLSTDPLGTVATLLTPMNVLLAGGAIIAGAVLLNVMGGGTRKRRRPAQPPTLLPMKTAVQLALGTLLVGGFAYEVGKKTA